MKELCTKNVIILKISSLGVVPEFMLDVRCFQLSDSNFVHTSLAAGILFGQTSEQFLLLTHRGLSPATKDCADRINRHVTEISRGTHDTSGY